MLFLVLVLGSSEVANALGLLSSPSVLYGLALINALAAFLFRPGIAALWLVLTPVIAATRGRRWWLWAMAGIALGPLALLVGLMPRVVAPESSFGSSGDREKDAA